MVDGPRLETAATEAPPVRATAATEQPVLGSEPTLAQGSVAPAGVAVLRTSPLRAVFVIAAVLGTLNLCYFVWRFLISAHPPALHTVFQTTARGGTLSVGFLDGPGVTLISISVVAATFLGVATWVARRHTSEGVVQLMTALAVLAGQVSFAVTELTSEDAFLPARIVAAAIYVGAPAAVFVLMVVFPNGRPVPWWSAWLVPIAVVPFVIQMQLMFSARAYSVHVAEMAMPAFALFLGCQWWRYRRFATLHERNQIKWLCYAAGTFATIQMIAVGGVLPLIMDPSRPSFPLLKLLYSVLIASSYMVALACVLFSAARYRLFDIDRIINRTIVYAVVTLVIASCFIVAFFAGRVALRAIEPSDTVAGAISLAASAALFPWTRRYVARWIDRRFYGIGLDYEPLAARAVRAAALTSSHLGEYDGMVLLGRGGMGAVYRAHHARFGVPVALKVIAPALAGDPDARARFQREAQILDGLRHPHVVPFLASGHEDGLAYIAMEYVEGSDLAKVLADRGRLPLADVATIIGAIAGALDVAHARGVVHRDVKPANILLERGDPAKPRLMDFGVARLAGDKPLPGDDQLVGSLPYIAPEQIQEPDRVDGRADIYALGITAYELLVGHPPFRDATPLALVMAHLKQPPADPRNFDPALPAPVAQALMRALAKAPDERFATAGELAAALR